MRKTLLLLCALLATFTKGMAENVAKNATVTLDGDAVSFYTIDNQTETVTVDVTKMSVFVDGEIGGNYRFAGYKNSTDTEGDFTFAGQAFILDFGSVKTNLDRIKVYFINAYATQFKLEYSTDGTTYTTWEDVEANTQETFTSKLETAVSAKYIKFTPKKAFVWNWGIAIKEIEVYEKETATLTTIEATATTSLTIGENSQITAKAYDQFGDEITDAAFTYSSGAPSIASVDVDGKITANAAGNATITVTAGGKSTTIDVTVTTAFVMPTTAPTAPTDAAADVYAVYSPTYSATTYTATNGAWNGGHDDYTEETVGEYSVLKSTHCGQFGLELPAGQRDVTAYKSLRASIYVAVDYNGTVADDNTKIADISLKAGQWNYIDVNIDGNTLTTLQYLMFNTGDKASQTVVITDIYFSKEAAADPAVIDKSTENVVKVTGTLTSEDTDIIDAINAADVLLIDLSGVTTIEGDVTITPKNANALVSVSGSETDGVYSADAKYATLAAKNQVVYNGWVFPVSQLEITDENGAKYWNGEGLGQEFVSTGTTGWKITRSIPANKTVTAIYPVAVTEVPSGLSVYTFTGYADNTIELTKVETINANIPYVIKNTTEGAVELVIEGIGDFDLNKDAGKTEQNSATFQGNYLDLTTDGSQFILNENEVKKGTGATVGSFRAYFTGVAPAGARAIFNDEDGTTGINKINLEKVLNGRFYNLQGQEVKNPTKGLYIVNGKKVILK